MAMRMLPWLVSSPLLIAVACGGTSFTGIDNQKDASAAKDAVAPADDAAVRDGGTVDAVAMDAPSSDGSTDDCATLLARIDQRRPDALKCCATCGALPCGQTVDDVCCPISVSDSNAPAVVDFGAAVDAYRQRCNPACAGSTCPAVPSQDCDPNTSQCR